MHQQLVPVHSLIRTGQSVSIILAPRRDQTRSRVTWCALIRPRAHQLTGWFSSAAWMLQLQVPYKTDEREIDVDVVRRETVDCCCCWPLCSVADWNASTELERNLRSSAVQTPNCCTVVLQPAISEDAPVCFPVKKNNDRRGGMSIDLKYGPPLCLPHRIRWERNAEDDRFPVPRCIPRRLSRRESPIPAVLRAEVRLPSRQDRYLQPATTDAG